MALHILCVLVKNQSGVLARVSGLISRRGFNIESLAVGETENHEISRMTILVECDERTLDQIVEQLRKQYCVITVDVLPREAAVSRELILIKVQARQRQRADVIQIASIFRARIVDVARDTLTLELTGETDKTDALLELLEEYGVLETVRTGTVALGRGGRILHGANGASDGGAPCEGADGISQEDCDACCDAADGVADGAADVAMDGAAMSGGAASECADGGSSRGAASKVASSNDASSKDASSKYAAPERFSDLIAPDDGSART